MLINGYGEAGTTNEYGRNFCMMHVEAPSGTAEVNAALKQARNEMHTKGNANAYIEITMTDQEYSMIADDCIRTGQMEAWDLARRILDSDDDCYRLTDLVSVFGTISFPVIFRKAVEVALKKDKKHQEELHTFHIGDQVITKEDGKGYVVFVGKDSVKILGKGGDCFWCCKDAVKKTGKTDSYIATIIKSLD